MLTGKAIRGKKNAMNDDERPVMVALFTALFSLSASFYYFFEGKTYAASGTQTDAAQPLCIFGMLAAFLPAGWVKPFGYAAGNMTATETIGAHFPPPELF